ncbi:putative transcription factor [Corchorus capsularis]|uniref:Putative transcription factor n=1 Tax=Corchorus capsularis TaxID=210143 RepID=A0A1R3IQ45_COCAP|nr:putative transcription factor [Corchorus capsularis]
MFSISLFLNVNLQLDDWVLCRIYKKSHSSSSTSTATASDQDQEEEETEQFVQDALLPALKSPPSNTTLMPQKSCSFSNLLDAMDYSMLSSFLADNPSNPTGYETSSFSFGNLDPAPPVTNYTNSSTSNSMMLQKHPGQLNTSVPNMENKLKRQYSGIDEDYLHNPSKKFISSCSYSNSTNQSDMTQYNFLNQSFFNQSLLLSPHLQFQG